MTPAPFLKWAGGKRRLLSELLPRIAPVEGAYFEPFLGGGAVFFALRAAGHLRGPVVLSDANARLIRSYRGVRDAVGDVLGMLGGFGALPRCREQYEAVRARPPDDGSDAEMAAWLIYMNRMGFNGLYRVNTAGHVNVPFGRRSDGSPPEMPEMGDLLRACSAALAGVDLAVSGFETPLSLAGEGSTVYCDPPYLDGGTFTAYTGAGFGPEDHARLASRALVAAHRGARVFLSNADSPEVATVYPEGSFGRERVGVHRSISCRADRRGTAGEVILRPLCIREAYAILPA